MRELTIGEICSACGGTLLRGKAETRVRYFSIDSRDVPEGTFFVPVIGEKVDAHRFLGDVREKGALGAFTSEGDPFSGETGGSDMALIAVPDTVKALHEINPDVLVMIASGVTTADDCYNVIRLGADGTGATSGILKAPSPAVRVREMAEAIAKAGKERGLI